MGKSSINGQFSMAMLNDHRIINMNSPSSRVAKGRQATGDVAPLAGRRCHAEAARRRAVGPGLGTMMC
jgi:hypothetical protein